MAKKEETYPEGYPRQKENFSDEQKFKFDVFEAIKEIALETTEKAFEDEGYEKKEGRAGEYGTGDSYGAGTSLNHFNIRLTSRPNTNTYFDKIIYFGGKKATTEISIGWDAKNKVIEMAYKNSEFGAFRGYGSKAGAQLINMRKNFIIKSLSEFKKELKAQFKSFAEKEVAYITSTKIGIQDKTEKSINSMVEMSMKKFSLKDLMTSSNEELSAKMGNYISEGEDKKYEEDKTRMNSPEIIAANSQDKLLFDDIEDIKDENFKIAAKNKLKKFGVVAINELRPSEKKTYFDELAKELEIQEMTGTGASGAGAGAYFTPMAFKKGGDLNLKEEEKKQKERFEKTPYAQGQKEKTYIKKTMKEGDSFWSTVELGKNNMYPKGMEHNFAMGQHDKNTDSNYPGKPKPIKEGEEKSPAIIKESLIKKKFTSLNENKEKGVNKRYIITEHRTLEEEENRWKKLAMFETYETIKKAENVIEECGCDALPAEHENEVSMEQGEAEDERAFRERNLDAEVGSDNIDGKVVIMVPKPNSLSNAMFKVYQEDYLNENKTYIKDLNSGNLVLNPNFKVKK